VALTDEMKQVVLEQKLGFVTTASPDGMPNRSPKDTTTGSDSSAIPSAATAYRHAKSG
jgi:hypothetical protein